MRDNGRLVPGQGGNPDWMNMTDIPNKELAALMPDILRETARWTDTDRGRSPHRMSMFDRQSYVAPDSAFSQFVVARKAVQNDDIVGGVLETTCGLTFQGIQWEGDNTDDADIFNQIATDLDLDTFTRQWFKEDYTYSQAVVGVWWGHKNYTVRGHTVTPAEPHALPDPATGLPTFSPKMDMKTGKPAKPKKVKRKKPYSIDCPVALTMLDPMKVIPLSPTMFGSDRLAWQSNKYEYEMYKAYRNGEILIKDEIMDKFFLAALDFTSDDMRGEREYLASLGADPRFLIELNPKYVFRLAPTRIPYERFADVRLKSVMPLLDMKQQLMEADRVALVGQANYILMIRIGEKDNPGLPEELDGARAGLKNLAKVPVVVGDHRLQIDIVTPDQQWALDPDRYDMIDKRILRRCLGSMISPDATDPGTSAKSLARVLEMKRHLFKRFLEDKIAKAVTEANKGTFDEAPSLEFMPRSVQIDSDSQIVQAVLALRTQGDLSRESALDFLGFDQVVEAMRRQNEEEMGYDDIFKTQVPFAAPGQGNAGTDPSAGGGIPGAPGGGRPFGGGKTTQSPQKQSAPRTPNGNAKKNGGK